ncbi:MAG: dihydrofolate reductase [Planctomycetes bacterium]|nr:dihydrofolate reductase [Planctomycetota bacterium]
MSQEPRVRGFLAMSLDGFIAGPNDEIDWLNVADGSEDTFTPFFKQIGALLMGRRSYDVASGFDGPWPYGDTPVLVATHRDLKPKAPSVSACAGTIAELVTKAKATSAPKDVYIDGGQIVRQALDAGLVDEITVTLIPTVLGKGIALFHGVERQHGLELVGERAIGKGLVSLVYVPKRP